MRILAGIIATLAFLQATPATGQNASPVTKLDAGQAEIHYLGHSGWAVRTRNHLLIFDYWEAM